MAKQNESRNVAAKPPRRTGSEALAQVRALSHPLRLRLLELFVERPRTTMQAAEAMGEAPTRLYHHVAALERAGLVRLRETRPNRGTTEKYFEAVRPSNLEGGEALLADKSGRRDLTAAAILLFDQARNELVKAVAAAASRRPDSMMAVRAVLRLSPANADRLVRELAHVIRKRSRRNAANRKPESENARRDHRERYSLTIALLPIGGVPPTKEIRARSARAPSDAPGRRRRSEPR